jgi:hypothetical protein
MLPMPQPICEGCWWHWLNYICNFSMFIVSLHWLDWCFNFFLENSIVWFNKNIIFLKFIHVCDSWKVTINNPFCSTWSLIFGGHLVSNFLHGIWSPENNGFVITWIIKLYAYILLLLVYCTFFVFQKIEFLFLFIGNIYLWLAYLIIYCVLSLVWH